MKKRGFALPTIIALSGIIGLMVATGYFLVNVSQLTTLATVRFQLAKEAADACLIRAIDEVNATGFCGNRDVNNAGLGIPLGANTSCTVRFRQSGRICFLRSEGVNGSSTVYKTAIIQAFFGMGLYTVRGDVTANYRDGMLNGCYYEADPRNNCFVPAFIASAGTISLGSVTPRSCETTPPSNPGVYGTPPVFTNAQFIDLVPLFFNVNCFASNFYRTAESCNYGLTDALVDTYSLRYRDNQPDFTFSPHGEPVINQTLLTDLQSSTSISQGPPNCRVTLSGDSTINLSNLIADLNSFLGGQAGQCQNVGIYTNSNLTLTGTPPIPTTIFMRGSPTSTSGTVLTLSGVSGTITGTTNFGENIYNLRIYSARPVRIEANSSNFRLLTTNQITTTISNITITNATIVQTLINNNQNNNITSPQNFVVSDGTGTLTITDSKLITRQVRFGTLNAYRDLFYVYANACPNCSRSTNTASSDACQSDARRCGWAYGSGGGRPSFSNNAYFGADPNRNIQDAQGRPLVSLLINNNSAVAGSQNFFGGIYFGQDVNYLLGVSGAPSVVRGFLVRNFPPNLSLNISFGSGVDFRFRPDAINNLRYDPNRTGFPGFWFVRRVDCVRENPTPAYMSIITRMTSW